MEKKYKKGIAISASLLVLAGAAFFAPLWTSNQAESPHYVDLACAVCHFYLEGSCESTGCENCHAYVGNDNAYSILKASELTLCTSCHTREGDVVVKNEEGKKINVNLGKSHPFGVRPKVTSMPATLPLRMGAVVCSTCHDVHSLNKESRMLRLYKPQSTGNPDWSPLCLDCHKDY